MSSNLISQPSVSINVLPASQEQSAAPQKVLFIGQMLTAGTATTGELQQSIGNASEENGLFGKDSMLAGMIRAGKIINGQTRFDAIGLDDAGAGVAATGTITFGGAPTESGTLEVTIGSEYNHSYDLSITTSSTITTIGDALEALVTADTAAPFSVANVAGVVTVTAKHKGTIGNGITLRVQGSVAGLTVATVAMASGATDPTLTALFDVVEGERYQTVVWPSEYGFTDVVAELDARFNVTNDVLDGVAISTKTDSLANLKTSGNAENSKSLVIEGNKSIDETNFKGSALVEFDYVISSQFAAVRSLRLTEDANISRYVTTNAALDSFGGAALATLPYFNTPFFELPQVPVGKGWTAQEVEELGDAGVSVLGNNRAGNTVISGETLTTRKTDTAGNPEDTFKYLNGVDTASSVREIYFNNLKSTYAQSRLTQGALIPGRSMANQASIEAFLDGLFATLGGQDYVLVQAGKDAISYFKANRTVSLDLMEGKVTISMKTPIVTQLRTIIASMQISFSTE